MSKAHDNGTVEGFLAIYDETARKLKTAKRWCSLSYAWSASGQSVIRPGSYAVPAPEQRADLLSVIPDKYLSDEGRQWQADKSAALLEEMRAGAREAIRYGLTGGNITEPQARAACTALGIGTLVKTSGYTTPFSASHTVAVKSKAALTEAKRTALAEVIDAAVTAAVASAGYEMTTGSRGEYDRPAFYSYGSRQVSSWDFTPAGETPAAEESEPAEES